MTTITTSGMEANPANSGLGQISVLLRGESEPINNWIRNWNAARAGLYVGVITAGAGLYGAAMGFWRAPQQALFVAIKFPLIILLTTLGNGLLNGMLAPLLGMNLGFRQSLQAVLMSFTIFATILGAFSPVIFFLVWNAPEMSPAAVGTYDFIVLTHVLVIAFAGTVSNLRLSQLLQRLSGDVAVSRRVLFAWLTGNFLLGTQLSWILRPFIGSPGLPVEFLRENAFRGNFFETVYRAFLQLISS